MRAVFCLAEIGKGFLDDALGLDGKQVIGNRNGGTVTRVCVDYYYRDDKGSEDSGEGRYKCYSKRLS